MIYIIML